MHQYISLVFSGHNTIRGHYYMAADACTVSTVDFYTSVSQGHGTTGKIPLGTLFFELIAPQQEIIDLTANRNIRLKSMAIYYKW